jgi:hypothetical protein
MYKYGKNSSITKNFILTCFGWGCYTFFGYIMLGYSFYIKNKLLICISSINIGISFIIIILKEYEFNKSSILDKIDYDTEFDYEPGYDYIEANNIIYRIS